MQILLVEDNQIEAELLRELLADAGGLMASVHHAQTLRQAQDWLDGAAAPDVVLLDLHLPDVLGFEGLRSLRERLPEVPVLVLTNAREPGLDERVLLEGAQDFLAKSRLRSESLLRAIRKAVARQQFSGGRAAEAVNVLGRGGVRPRGTFMSLVGHSIMRAERGGPGTRGAVVFAAAAPHMSDQIAQALVARMRPSDACTRIATGVLGLLLLDVGSAEQAASVAERLAGAISGIGQVRCGIAMCDAQARVVDVLSAADTALARASDESRFCCLADPVSDRRVVLKRQAVDEVAAALNSGELTVQYQPEVDLDTGQVTGFEALLRWNHPLRGELAAAAFIDAVDQSEVIDSLDWFVLATAVGRVRRWQELFPVDPPLSISVNLSRRCFEKATFARDVLALLEDKGLLPGCLRLEVPGSGFSGIGETGRRQRAELRAAGVSINVDGLDLTQEAVATGLWAGEFDVVKIAREGLASISHAGALEGEVVESILALGRVLGFEFVAKGVETVEQALWLRDRGCPRAQGHWFAGALPDDAVQELLKKSTAGDGGETAALQ